MTMRMRTSGWEPGTDLRRLRRLNAGKGQTGGKAGEAGRQRVSCVQSWGSPSWKVLQKTGAGGARMLAVMQVEASSGGQVQVGM